MPMLDIQRRHAEVFRIRLGDRQNGQMRKLTDAIRITSPNAAVVKAFTDVFGGDVRDWEGQFEAYLPTTELPIMVLPGQSITQWWEKYRKSVCERRCDGETETLSGKACVCPADITERMASKDGCRPMTRVNVVCPDVAVVGAGSLVTHGLVAAETLPQSIAVAEAALARGLMVPAVLRVVEHKGKTHYIVPQIEIVGMSLTQLTTGEVPTRQLESVPEPKAIAAPAPTAKPAPPKKAAAAPASRPRPPLPGEVKANPYAKAIHVLASDVAKATGLDATALADVAVSIATGGKSTSANDLNSTNKDFAVVFLCEVRDGKALLVSSFDADGKESYTLESKATA